MEELESRWIASHVCLPLVYGVSQGRQKENNRAPVCCVKLKGDHRVNNVGGVGRGNWGDRKQE